MKWTLAIKVINKKKIRENFFLVLKAYSVHKFFQ